MGNNNQVKMLNKHWKLWHEAVMEFAKENPVTEVTKKGILYAAASTFISSGKPRKRLVSGREFDLSTLCLPYFFNKLIFNNDSPYSVYKRENLQKVFSHIEVQVTSSKVIVRWDSSNFEALLPCVLKKNKSYEMPYIAMAFYEDGLVQLVKKDGDSVVAVSGWAESPNKSKKPRDETPGITTYSGRMKNAVPVWRGGYPEYSGIYICGVFGHPERDVLSRSKTPDEKTTVPKGEEASRVESNLYFFDREALTQGKCPWQHASGFYDKAITHYLDFEVDYSE